ncbi:MAG: ArnT family glycosyltransferase [Phycisphaeraceae bacterium]
MTRVLSSSSAPPLRTAASPLRLWLGLFAAALLLYGFTAARTIQWQDSGLLVLRVLDGELVNPMGLALTHPLYYWLASAAVRLLPVEPAFALPLASSLMGAVAVANVALCVWMLTRRRSAAIFSGLTLALAHTFWQLATLPETYTLSAALLTAEIACLIAFFQGRGRRWALVMWLFAGLGLANHNLALLSLPVLVAVTGWAWRKRLLSGPQIALALVLWLVGTLPYSAIVLEHAVQTGDLGGTVQSALFGDGYQQNVLNVQSPIRPLVIGSLFVLMNFPNLALPLAVWGIARGRRVTRSRIIRAALAAELAIFFLFAIRYNVVDQHFFFLPAYCLLAIFAGLGWTLLLDRADEKRWARAGLFAAALLLAVTPSLYAIAPRVAREANVLGSLERDKPYRDDYRYLLLPWSAAEVSAHRMSEAATDLAGPGGIIVARDGMGRFAIEYQLRRRGWENVELRSDLPAHLARDAAEQNRPVVLVPRSVSEPDLPDHVGPWLRQGEMYVLGR